MDVNLTRKDQSGNSLDKSALTTRLAFPVCIYPLTGVIGSGKTGLARELAARGAAVVDADLLSRQAVEPGSEGARLIREVFGAEYFQDDGTLDRKKLGRLVFSSPADKEKLEDIIHPVVRKLAIEEFHKICASKPLPPFIIYDVPLLFETRYGIRDLAQATITVSAPHETVIERIMNRDKCTRETALSRLRAHLPQEEKEKRATFVVDNNGSKEDLKRLAGKVYDELVACSQMKHEEIARKRFTLKPV